MVKKLQRADTEMLMAKKLQKAESDGSISGGFRFCAGCSILTWTVDLPRFVMLMGFKIVDGEDLVSVPLLWLRSGERSRFYKVA